MPVPLPPPFKKTFPCTILPPLFLSFQIPSPSPLLRDVIKIYFHTLKGGGGGGAGIRTTIIDKKSSFWLRRQTVMPSFNDIHIVI